MLKWPANLMQSYHCRYRVSNNTLGFFDAEGADAAGADERSPHPSSSSSEAEGGSSSSPPVHSQNPNKGITWHPKSKTQTRGAAHKVREHSFVISYIFAVALCFTSFAVYKRMLTTEDNLYLAWNITLLCYTLLMATLTACMRFYFDREIKEHLHVHWQRNSKNRTLQQGYRDNVGVSELDSLIMPKLSVIDLMHSF